MKTLILYSTSSTFRPRSVIASLSSDEQKKGHEVTVLDIGEFSYVTQDLPPAWFARMMGHRVHRGALNAVFAANNVAYSRLAQPTSDSGPLPRAVNDELDDAVFSELVTYLNTDEPNFDQWFTRYTAKKMRQTAAPLYSTLREFLDPHGFERALVPNGRVPDQRMALLACQDAGIPVEYYEIGRARENSYYLGATQVHDRDATQKEVHPKTAHLSEKQIKKMANDWLATRMGTGLSIHPYNKNWNTKKTLDGTSPTSRPTAVFFSSSVDEFASYGGSWKKHTWSDQYEAFAAILAELSNRDIDCVLRVHPNLQNKSREYVRRELSRIRAVGDQFPALTVLGHMDRTNSYELLERADMIFVGRSTLGLEASALGKCVWMTTAARYDDIADVRSLLDPADVTPQALTPWVVNPSGAHRFVAYWVTQDNSFSFGESQWCSWDSLQTPTRLRLGNLLVKNSLPHKLHLLRLELTKWRNRKVAV